MLILSVLLRLEMRDGDVIRGCVIICEEDQPGSEL
jgi:hypothetical protein